MLSIRIHQYRCHRCHRCHRCRRCLQLLGTWLPIQGLAIRRWHLGHFATQETDKSYTFSYFFNLSNLSSGGTFFLIHRFSKMPWPDSMETCFLICLSQQRRKIIQNRQRRLSKGQCTTVQTSMMASSKWNALSCSKSSAVPFIDQCSSCWKQNKVYTTGNPVPSGSVFIQAAGKQTNFSSFGSPTVQRVQGLKHQNQNVENGHCFKAAQFLRWSQIISDYLSAPSSFSVPLCFSMVKRREFGPSIRSCHSWWKLLREGVSPYPPLVQVAVRKQKRSCNGPICTGQKEICTLVFNLWTLWKPGHKIKSKSRCQVFEIVWALSVKFVTPPFRCQICHLRRISVESPSNLRRIPVLLQGLVIALDPPCIQSHGPVAGTLGIRSGVGHDVHDLIHGCSTWCLARLESPACSISHYEFSSTFECDWVILGVFWCVS